jgi:filamentous hemagglutinin family protein
MKPFSQKQKNLWFAVLVILLARAEKIFANPTGLSPALGNATAQQIGSQLNVTVSQLAILNWQSFNIGAGETTTFLQPSVNSVVFNQIGGANPSQILGNLNANGTVILANANGFYFGNGSVIKVGGSFISTTAALTPDFGTAAAWQFTGMPPLASIVNYGQIQVGAGKSLFLIAENIENHGSLTAPAGKVELAAGQNVLVSETPDGRGLSAAVTLPQGSVDNFGRITADAGTIALNARVVNQNGVLQADSVQNQNGEMELLAADALNLGANSQILARGDGSTGGSVGGNVVLKSGAVFSDANGSQIFTAGGANGGNGGNVEVSAPDIESLNSAMDAVAQAGSTSGKFLLDPVNIELGTSSSYNGTVPNSGTVDENSSGSTLKLNVNTAFKNKNFSQILLEASGNISIDPNTTWNLSSTVTTAAGASITTGRLILEAGGDIIFSNGSKIF